MTLHFYKYHGAGNDFIMLDNRSNSINLTAEQIAQLCHRHFGVGADGLILLTNHLTCDFEMIYFNADGNESSMCGNGGRCIVKFAYDLGMRKSTYSFKAVDGMHEAKLEDNNWVELKMNNVNGVKTHYGDFILNTGSPHYVKSVQNLRNYDVVTAGRSIRYNDKYTKEGINVNFVEAGNKHITVRTYERGVENETLSCGTGVTAAALVFAHNEKGFNRVEVETLGGRLAVEFEKSGEQSFENIWLCGPAEFVFTGEIKI